MLCKYKLEVCGMCQHQPEYVVPYHVDFFSLCAKSRLVFEVFTLCLCHLS